MRSWVLGVALGASAFAVGVDALRQNELVVAAVHGALQRVAGGTGVAREKPMLAGAEEELAETGPPAASATEPLTSHGDGTVAQDGEVRPEPENAVRASAPAGPDEESRPFTGDLVTAAPTTEPGESAAGQALAESTGNPGVIMCMAGCPGGPGAVVYRRAPFVSSSPAGLVAVAISEPEPETDIGCMAGCYATPKIANANRVLRRRAAASSSTQTAVSARVMQLSSEAPSATGRRGAHGKRVERY